MARPGMAGRLWLLGLARQAWQGKAGTARQARRPGTARRGKARLGEARPGVAWQGKAGTAWNARRWL